MLYVNDVDKIKARWSAFWNGEIIDRCLAVVTARRSALSDEERKIARIPSDPAELARFWTDAEWVTKRRRIAVEHTWFGGDAFPLAHIDLGAAGHAGFFKGEEHSFDKNTVWFKPTLEDLDDLEFDEDSFLYKKTLELARAAAEDSKGEYMISMSDCSGNIDVLSHLLGSEELMIRMIEEPDKVCKAMEKIQFAYQKIHQETFDIVKDVNSGGSCVGWLRTWAPGFHAQMQSDMSVMLSNDMFKQFVEPELRAQSKFLDYALYHLDGVEQLRHLDTLLSIDGLRTIQWTQVVGQPPCTEFIPELQKIQRAGKNLLIRVTTPSQIEPLMQNLSSKGLCLLVDARSSEEGNSILKNIEKWTHE